jgi:hypothetical protein
MEVALFGNGVFGNVWQLPLLIPMIADEVR